MRVYGEAGDTEGLCHHYARRFMSYPRQSFEAFEVLRYFAAMLIDEDLT